MTAPGLEPGAVLGPYRILGPLGAGGMGEVYRAHDTRLDRQVAVKVLPADAASSADRRRRFEQEARAVSRLNHPGIVTLYGIEPFDAGPHPVDVLIMELVPGESLDRRLAAGPLPVDAAVSFARQAAEALAAAHAAGVVHRDLKPANLMVTPDDRLKILDFGLARLEPGQGEADATTLTGAPPTSIGAVLGTAGYLSPEQAAGERADARSDLFSLGVVMYEMLNGRAPFRRDSAARSMAAVLHETPPPLSASRRDVPPALEDLVSRCLTKNPEHRPASAAAVAADLARLSAPPAAATTRRLVTAALIGALAVTAVAAWVWFMGRHDRWARTEAIPTLERLIVDDRLFDAFVLAREIERRAPDTPALALLWPTFATAARFESTPPGVEVAVKDFASPDADWMPVGTTPLDLWTPLYPLRLRATSAGYDPLEISPQSVGPTDDGRLLFRIALTEANTAPSGMVRVSGGPITYRGAPTVDLPDFWIDRLEVTNADYQRFVDDGGYQREEFWPEDMTFEDGPLAFGDAVARALVDATGRPGPSTWELGHFPDGTGDHPVSGVSWYEASAYAAWAGRSLPTFYHWYRAASPFVFAQVVQFSRFGGNGAVPAGSAGSLGPWGTQDMAGNVKEWTSTATERRRYALGGSWQDPAYLFSEPEAFVPWLRSSGMGFRTAQFDVPLPAAILAPVESTRPAFADMSPVSDEVFAAIANVYSYDRTIPLDPLVESIDDTPERWAVERISIAAAYDDERLPIYVYHPRDVVEPTSAVLYLPDSTAEWSRSTADLPSRWFEFLAASGRTVIVPVYKGMYERRDAQIRAWTAEWRRDRLIAWSRDIGRTMDYLETRSDVDAARVAFFGLSLGGIYAPVLTALEPRFAASVIVGGGYVDDPLPPESHPINFAPRVKAPTLMVAGRDDFLRPIESHQRPLFELLGVPDDQKRLAVLDGGHLPPRLNDVAREILDWLDRWLGPA